MSERMLTHAEYREIKQRIRIIEGSIAGAERDVEKFGAMAEAALRRKTGDEARLTLYNNYLGEDLVAFEGALKWDLYLHNIPTPPVGDTNSQTSLLMDTVIPISLSLFNYDTDRDNEAGLYIKVGGDIGSVDTTRFQSWQTAPLEEDFHLTDAVGVEVWAALKGSPLDVAGEITVFLRDFDGVGFTEITNVTMFKELWQDGEADFTKVTAEAHGIDYTILQGHCLEVRIVVGVNSGKEMLIAYDTAEFPSSITLTRMPE